MRYQNSGDRSALVIVVNTVRNVAECGDVDVSEDAGGRWRKYW
jgi:hypothetical protein